MNARDIIKLAAKLYIDDYLKKKTTYVLKINEKMNELWSEEALIRQGAKIKQELLEIQKILDELEKQGDM